MPKSPARLQQATRIQAQSRNIILNAALEVFSTFGYRGATVDQIAKKAGFSKPNVLYYFRRKEDIYVALLEATLEEWLKPLRILDVKGEPVQELTRYISEKLDLSFANPQASRLFANEILHGAPHVQKFLRGPLRLLVEEKCKVIAAWIAQGKIRPIDPRHFIFAVWAVTQHYADFAAQVESISGTAPKRTQTKKAVLDILLHGLVKAPRGKAGRSP